MKCICVKDCYIKHESERPILYNRGDIIHFEECPSHFASLEEAFTTKEDAKVLTTQEKMSGVKPDTGAFDFSTASEELLMAADYDTDQLRSFAKTRYGADIPVGEPKATTVARFVDARYRFTVNQTAMNKITESKTL